MILDEHSKHYRASLEPLKFLFEDFIGKPVTVLETGVYQGGSALWFLDTLGPQAFYIGIDDSVREEATDNLANRRALLLYGDSKQVLPKLHVTVDIAHIDGEHSYDGCFEDLVYIWSFLRSGGLLLVDDYDRADYGVKAAVDTFAKNAEVEPCYKGYKIAFRKPAHG